MTLRLIRNDCPPNPELSGWKVHLPEEGLQLETVVTVSVSSVRMATSFSLYSPVALTLA